MTLSHKQLAAWYLQLSQMQGVGLPLSEAIGSAHGPNAADRQAMAAQLDSGQSVEAVLDAAPSWLPKADRMFLKAAAETGRLPQTFVALAERHKRIGGSQLKGILACIYPLGVLHFGILVFPILGMIDMQQGFMFSLPIYLREVIMVLGPLWAVIFLIIFLVKIESPIIPILMGVLPGLRGYYKGQSLADLAFALEAFLEAGLPIGKSWASAGAVSGNPRLKKAAEEVRQIIDNGGQPSQQLAACGCFPSDFIAIYTSGERTGQLTTSLAQIGRNYVGKANLGIGIAMVIYPLMIFLVVVGIIVVNIFSFYGGYLDNINKMME